jgi:glycosyltransferase involved in cell wall biosynthesis
MRALIVTYVFPPTGGAGVGRPLKLAKFLPEHGVAPSILTVANPSVPVHDDSLQRDVDPDMEVVRARTLEPGYAVKQAAWEQHGPAGAPRLRGLRRLSRPLVGKLASLGRAALVPDPQVLWQPAAQLALARRLVRRRDDVVFISGPPFSQFLLAPLARLGSGVAVVLDYRDEWVTYRTSYEMMGQLGARLGEPLERALLRSAHAVTTATEAFRDNLLAGFPFLDPAAVHAIPNGYDPDDFPEELPAPPTDRFVLTYAGTVFKLTSPRGLLGALRLLRERSPELARLLEVRFIGRVVETEAALFEGSEALGVKRYAYMEKYEVNRELAGSHMVLCTLDEVPGNEAIYPGKIFELMYLGRPCLTLAPEGALAALCRDHRLGAVLPPRDEAAIATFLATALEEFRAGRYAIQAPAVGIERYHRRALAGEFAAVFRHAVERARG